MALSQSTTVFINYLASQYVFANTPLLSPGPLLTEISSANENTVNAGKKTISPADVFKALEETEFGFLREPLEAEFASTYTCYPVHFIVEHTVHAIFIQGK